MPLLLGSRHFLAPQQLPGDWIESVDRERLRIPGESEGHFGRSIWSHYRNLVAQKEGN